MSNKLLDFRSDTVTHPTADMRKAMASAPVGDDVYGEDPTVAKLESELAARAGFEAGLFVASGTQANLVAVLTHCERGDEYIVGDLSHIYKWEAGGASVLGGLLPAVLPLDDQGRMDIAHLVASVKPEDVHFPRTRLVCIENTFHGHALSLDYLEALKQCRASTAIQAGEIKSGLKWHLDGARLFNASVYHGEPLARLTDKFDSVSLCLSKGLGAPLGSVLCGNADFIHSAKRWRKMVGGGMRQAGIVAAGGLYALEHHVERLAEDHANAAFLADALSQIDELAVAPAKHRTNMLFLKHRSGLTQSLHAQLASEGVLVSLMGPDEMRVVTHLDLTRGDCAYAVEIFKTVVKALG